MRERERVREREIPVYKSVLADLKQTERNVECYAWLTSERRDESVYVCEIEKEREKERERPRERERDREREIDRFSKAC